MDLGKKVFGDSNSVQFRIDLISVILNNGFERKSRYSIRFHCNLIPGILWLSRGLVLNLNVQYTVEHKGEDGRSSILEFSQTRKNHDQFRIDSILRILKIGTITV